MCLFTSFENIHYEGCWFYKLVIVHISRPFLVNYSTPDYLFISSDDYLLFSLFKQSQNTKFKFTASKKILSQFIHRYFYLRLCLKYSKLIQPHCLGLYFPGSLKIQNRKKKVLGFGASLTSFKIYLQLYDLSMM